MSTAQEQTKILAAKYAEHLRKIKASSEKKSGRDDRFLVLPKEEGTTLVRILPDKDGGPENFMFTAHEHRVKIPGKDYESRFGCIKKTDPEANCPFCTLRGILFDTNDKEYRALAIKLYAKDTHFVNVLDRNTKTVKVYSFGKTIADKINGTIDENIKDYAESGGEFVDVLSPLTGQDFKIMKTESTPYPKYDASMFRPKSEPLGTTKEIADYMSNLHDLTEFQNIKSYEEMKEAALSITPEELIQRFRNKLN